MGRIPAALLIQAALALYPLAAQQQPTFRFDVRLVRVLATVKDPAGNLIGSLNQSDFRLFDNGIEQKLSVFERQTELPLSVCLLVDTSASTAKDLKSETDSVHRFVRAYLREGNPQDEAALYTFNWQVMLQKSYTRRLDSIESALRRLKPEGGTSMYDAIFLASRDLAERDGRKAIIIVTDGGDTTSTKNFHQALESAHLADATIYPIVIVPITNDAGRNIGGENALTTLASGTGGRIFSPTLGAELDNAFEEILRDLRTQYLLGYYPKGIPPTKNRFHQLKVEVKRPGLRVLARSGYYGDSDDSATSQ